MMANTTLQPPEKFKIRIEMLSDWHVGIGAGRPGDVDRLVARDRDGLPYIPGKTMRGIWRDACERLAWGLDDGKPGEWCRLVSTIFGSQPGVRDTPGAGVGEPASDDAPNGSRLDLRPAQMSAVFRDAFRDVSRRSQVHRRQLRSALTFIKPGVEIDPQRGQARDEHLRTWEMARAQTELIAEGQLLDLPDGLRDSAWALMVAALRLIERLGAKRRRGAGRCRWEIVGYEGAAELQFLADNQTPPRGLERTGTSEGALPAAPVRDEKIWEVPLTLAPESPLAISHRTVGNVVECLEHVPGTMLLPHITKSLKQRGINIVPDVIGCEIAVTNATYVIGGERSRPGPMILSHPKHEKTPLTNEFIAENDDGDARKPLREVHVVTTAGGKLVSDQPPKRIATHNTVHDQHQCPSTNGVYSYEALSDVDREDRRVEFQAVLRVPDRLIAGLKSDWAKDLNGKLKLGRSKQDDYGRAQIDAGVPRVCDPNLHASDDPYCWRVWLLSDCLLRSRFLAPSPTARGLAQAICQRLALPDDTLEVDASRVRVHRLDSWHARWGLPRPSLIGLQSGSCVQLRSKQPLTKTMLQRLSLGVGERTAEGFGQIAINDPLLEQEQLDLVEAADVHSGGATESHPRVPKIGSNDPTHTSARMIERAAWEREIQSLAIIHAPKICDAKLHWDQTKPTMSQLGGLRDEVMRLVNPQDAQLLIQWLKHLLKSRNRCDSWGDANEGPGRVQAVINLLSDAGTVWKWLAESDQPDLADKPDLAVLTVDGAESLLKEMWPFAIRAVLDSCIRTHKRSLEKEG